MLKYALLGFLNYGDKTGYELKQSMDTSTQNFWHAKQSQIYMTLKRLEQSGLVISEIEPQEGRPDRRVYTITDEGKTDLQKWLASPITTRDSRKELLLLKLSSRPILAGKHCPRSYACSANCTSNSLSTIRLSPNR